MSQDSFNYTSELVKDRGSKGDTTFYFKILNAELNHNGFQYKLGLNIDTQPFKPNVECGPGGLYYADIDHIYEFVNFGSQIAQVEPKGQIQAYSNKYKTDQLYIHSITPLKEWFDQQSESTHFIAVQQNGVSIYYIRNPSEALQLAAVKKDGTSIKWIQKPTELVQIAAVKQNKWAIELIKGPRIDAIIAASLQFGYGIRHLIKM